MRKRSFQFLVFGLAALAVLLGVSVGLMLYLERTPGLRRETEGLRSDRDAEWQNYYYEALERFNQGQFAEADRLAKWLLAGRPGADKAWQLQGLIAFRRGFYEDAERAFRQQLRIQPANAGGFSNLSQTLARLGRKKEALNAARRAVELSPENGAIALSAAGIAAEAGEEEEAAQLLRSALHAGVSPDAISRNPALVKLLEQPQVLETLKDPERESATPPEPEKGN